MAHKTTVRVEKWVRTAASGKRYAVNKITERDALGRFGSATNRKGTERLTLYTDIREWRA